MSTTTATAPLPARKGGRTVRKLPAGASLIVEERPAQPAGPTAAELEQAFLAGLAASLEQTQREAAAVAAASLAARKARVAADKAAAELLVKAPQFEVARRAAVRRLNNIWGDGYSSFLEGLSAHQRAALARPAAGHPLTLEQVLAYWAELSEINLISAIACR